MSQSQIWFINGPGEHFSTYIHCFHYRKWKKMQYSVGHKYKGQMEVATFWCGFVFQQLDIQFWSQRASSCLRWTQQRRRWRTVVGKDKKRTKSEKIYFKISKDIDHYKQLIVDAGNGIIWKNTLHSEPKCIFSGQKFSKKLLKILNKIRGVFWNTIGHKMRATH